MYFHNGFIYHYSYWIKWNRFTLIMVSMANRRIQRRCFTVVQGQHLIRLGKDANAMSSATPITVYPQLTASAAVTKTLDCTSTKCYHYTTITEVERHLLYRNRNWYARVRCCSASLMDHHKCKPMLMQTRTHL
jgi:hypothetical protein